MFALDPSQPRNALYVDDEHGRSDLERFEGGGSSNRLSPETGALYQDVFCQRSCMENHANPPNCLMMAITLSTPSPCLILVNKNGREPRIFFESCSITSKLAPT